MNELSERELAGREGAWGDSDLHAVAGMARAIAK